MSGDYVVRQALKLHAERARKEYEAGAAERERRQREAEEREAFRASGLTRRAWAQRRAEEKLAADTTSALSPKEEAFLAMLGNGMSAKPGSPPALSKTTREHDDAIEVLNGLEARIRPLTDEVVEIVWDPEPARPVDGVGAPYRGPTPESFVDVKARAADRALARRIRRLLFYRYVGGSFFAGSTAWFIEQFQPLDTPQAFAWGLWLFAQVAFGWGMAGLTARRST